MARLTIQIPEVLTKALEEAGRLARQSPSEVALDLVRRGLAARGIREARARVQNELGTRAPETDDDAFRALQ